MSLRREKGKNGVIVLVLQLLETIVVTQVVDIYQFVGTLEHEYIIEN